MEEDQPRRQLKRNILCTNTGQIKYIEEINNEHEWLGYRIHSERQDIVIKISKPRVWGENYGVYCGKKQGEDTVCGVISQINLYERVGEQTSDFSREKSIIVELVTDNGALEFIIYCEHNGYYAHDYCIRIGTQVINGRI
jgi:hypothetical protein